MQVIKRDGAIADYDRAKIAIAIGKANAEMQSASERATGEEIESILDFIEAKKKKRMLVEDIQDIIEQKLMEQGHYALAKTYIIYRYNRALVRKANTTDEAILSLIHNSNKDVMEENSNKNALAAATQRDLIAGEVSKDLKYARIYVSVMGDSDAAIAALNSSAGFIRRQLAARLRGMRTVPALTFKADTSEEYGRKIDSILKEISEHEQHS